MNDYLELIEEILEEKGRPEITAKAVLGSLRMMFNSSIHNFDRFHFEHEADILIQIADKDGLEEVKNFAKWAW